LRFGCAFRMVFVYEIVDMALVGLEVVGGEDDGLAGEAMAEGVEGGAAFAGFGSGAGRVLRIGSVDFGSVD
jgi:hypothetical protein